MAEKLVAVEIEFYDKSGASALAATTLRLSSGTLTATIGGVWYHYHPVLETPVYVGARLDVQNYGAPIRGTAEGGSLRFALGADNSQMRSFLNTVYYAVVGRTLRIYEGNVGDAYAALSLVFTGRVQGIAHDANRATLQFTDARVDLDKPLATVYTDTFPDGIQGRPATILFGEAYQVAPVLVDPVNNLWGVCSDTTFSSVLSVMAVRVGQVAWDSVGGTPAQGQWKLANAREIQLGGTTENGEVRCDARTGDYTTLTAGNLAALVIGAANVDTAKRDQLNASAPYKVGWWRGMEAINRQDFLDDVLNGVGAWWVGDSAGKIAMGAIEAPKLTSSTPNLVEGEFKTGVDGQILSFEQTALIEPAWRLRVEYKRNQAPASQVYPTVPDQTAEAARAPGIVAPEWSDGAIQTAYPRAGDVYLRTVVNTEAEAKAIRDRLATAWRVQRRLYNVSAFLGAAPAIYDTLNVSFQDFGGPLRVVGYSRPIGGGPWRLLLWG